MITRSKGHAPAYTVTERRRPLRFRMPRSFSRVLVLALVTAGIVVIAGARNTGDVAFAEDGREGSLAEFLPTGITSLPEGFRFAESTDDKGVTTAMLIFPVSHPQAERFLQHFREKQRNASHCGEPLMTSTLEQSGRTADSGSGEVGTQSLTPIIQDAWQTNCPFGNSGWAIGSVQFGYGYTT